jgi:hypothetical protein
MWIYLIVVAVLGFGIYAFLSITGIQTRWLSHRSNKTAESTYDNYGDRDRKEPRHAEEHGGTSVDAERAARPGQ